MKDAKECRDVLKSEAAEHAELWKRSPKFRAAVETRLKGPKAARKAMGKR